MAGRVRVGISGWRYPSWRGDFYPRGLAQARELQYVGETMSTLELNGSFYSLQRPSSYRRWREAVPAGFVFAVKGSRYITHMLRLRGIEVALANFFASGVLALGAQLGPVLWQLPEREEFDPDVLEAFLASLPRTTGAALEIARRHDARLDGRAWLEIERDAPIRYALEPRSATFEHAALAPLLRAHDVALVVADTAGRFPAFGEATASFVYVRLHGAEDLYTSGYTDTQLDAWAARVRDWRDGTTSGGDGKPRDVYVYFDNDARGHAPHDAVALARRLGDGPAS
ncbi:DUF72 domain-containing protein [Microbacterium sp. zg.Y1090]|uniref:DUF72 domain-containing protein n=1 Tax=Microbacterium TaxID=33882 RepID=UPI00214CD899|nr:MULTISPECIES: DUF72 domain-containing protein [unclassified Microbacterium]MCR2812461.1 DUF72 domain-containing protein [Microbacterium sp. zg.Y1084]MCR2817738.1 DUF72 domain-containing protein [Microbacterium sp. zg.Y1090]MDL5485619.1 DUF72 domain-containing protein [Microbacterium sp. zg-Y1211]WIM28790.1 DUF72 domain-containing protein [Microbacterium sp. zg-Y1090]